MFNLVKFNSTLPVTKNLNKPTSNIKRIKQYNLVVQIQAMATLTIFKVFLNEKHSCCYVDSKLVSFPAF